MGDLSDDRHPTLRSRQTEVERLDRLAAERGTNRSELLRPGAAPVLEASELATADGQLQESYRRIQQDPALVTVAARLAARTTPEW